MREGRNRFGMRNSTRRVAWASLPAFRALQGDVSSLRSAELHEVVDGQRSSGKLDETCPNRERSEVDAEESEPVDQCADLRLRCVVIARIEQNAPAALGPGVAGEDVRLQVIERLHDARA